MQGTILDVALLYFLLICSLYFSTCMQHVDTVYSLKKVCELYANYRLLGPQVAESFGTRIAHINALPAPVTTLEFQMYVWMQVSMSCAVRVWSCKFILQSKHRLQTKTKSETTTGSLMQSLRKKETVTLVKKRQQR